MVARKADLAASACRASRPAVAEQCLALIGQAQEPDRRCGDGEQHDRRERRVGFGELPPMGKNLVAVHADCDYQRKARNAAVAGDLLGERLEAGALVGAGRAMRDESLEQRMPVEIELPRRLRRVTHQEAAVGQHQANVDVGLNLDRTIEVQEIVERHGGVDDSGEAPVACRDAPGDGENGLVLRGSGDPLDGRSDVEPEIVLEFLHEEVWPVVEENRFRVARIGGDDPPARAIDDRERLDERRAGDHGFQFLVQLLMVQIAQRWPKIDIVQQALHQDIGSGEYLPRMLIERCRETCRVVDGIVHRALAVEPDLKPDHADDARGNGDCHRDD
jgi:hypothetical protein